ncbi:hypothetical protein STENM327S_05153 [Streptomyces tendae]
MSVRRPVAWTVAVVLFVEAVGVAALNWFLGIVVDRQDMSLAGLDPDMMSVSSKIGGHRLRRDFALGAPGRLLGARVIRRACPGGLGGSRRSASGTSTKRDHGDVAGVAGPHEPGRPSRRR